MRSVRTYETPIISAYTYGDQQVDVNQILNCPFEDIREAAEKIPALIGWFSGQKGMALERQINADYRRDQAEARAYFELKGGKFTSLGYGEKMTEEALKKAVLLMPEVTTAHEEFAKQKRSVERINGIIEALKAKLELVRSSEATRRMEHEPDRYTKPTE